MNKYIIIAKNYDTKPNLKKMVEMPTAVKDVAQEMLHEKDYMNWEASVIEYGFLKEESLIKEEKCKGESLKSKKKHGVRE